MVRTGPYKSTEGYDNYLILHCSFLRIFLFVILTLIVSFVHASNELLTSSARTVDVYITVLYLYSSPPGKTKSCKCIIISRKYINCYYRVRIPCSYSSMLMYLKYRKLHATPHLALTYPNHCPHPARPITTSKTIIVQAAYKCMTLWDCLGKIPAVIALQVRHRMSVARLVKSSASCTDDIINTVILPLCSIFIYH